MTRLDVDNDTMRFGEHENLMFDTPTQIDYYPSLTVLRGHTHRFDLRRSRMNRNGEQGCKPCNNASWQHQPRVTESRARK
jgi:hypothetical protein